MLKAVGLITVIAVCTGGGFCFSSRLKEKQKRLALICDFLRETSHGIRMGKALVRIIEEKGERSGVFVRSGEIFVEDERISTSDVEFLQSFLVELGRGDRESEAARCEVCLEVFSEKEKTALDAYKKGASLYGKLGLLSGLFLAVLFI